MRNYYEIALQYCDDVKTGKRSAGLLEKQAVKRFLNDLKRAKNDPEFEYRFDVDRAAHACFFIETCPHVKGVLAKPNKDGSRNLLVMEPWQVFATINIFGWVDSNDLRRFLYVYIEIAKKNGKSTWIAAIGIYMCFIDGEMGAEVYAAATSREQANIVFGDALAMVEASKHMQNRFGIDASKYSIFQSATNSSFKALSQDRGGTKDGLNIHCALVDELHAHKDSSMYDILANGVAAREQPLVIAITTAGDDTTGVCYREREALSKVLKGKSKHEQMFGMIFCLDKNDDWKDPKNWEKANPNYGISVSAKYLQSIFDKCGLSPSNEAIFRQKHLNEWVGAVDGWIAETVWTAAKRDVNESEFKGQVCFGGYDLASQLDLACWGRLRPRLEDGVVHWYFFVSSYINENVIETKQAINGEKRPDEYPVWRDDGHLIETPGNSTDFDWIEQDIIDFHKENPFYEVGYDPYYAQQLTSHLIDQDINAIEVPQKAVHLNPAMRWIEKLLADKRLHHDGNPILSWGVLNVVVKEDAKEMIFPRKISKAKKIDPAVALIIAAARAQFYDDEDVFELVPGEGGDDWDADDYIANMVVGRR